MPEPDDELDELERQLQTDEPIPAEVVSGVAAEPELDADIMAELEEMERTAARDVSELAQRVEAILELTDPNAPKSQRRRLEEIRLHALAIGGWLEAGYWPPKESGPPVAQGPADPSPG